MVSRSLVRDKLEGDGVVENNDEYKELLFKGIIERYQELYLLPSGKSKARAYELMADILELSGCINNQYLVAKSEVATIARHTAGMKKAKELAEEDGGFFNGVVAEWF
tara:strand:- start:770 stop:1093 length:324 start_codon:yes stop_codon:yes gene_type:complete